MAHVFFHPGPEKTGSTLLQVYMELNLEAIAQANQTSISFISPGRVHDSGLLAQAQDVIKGRVVPELLSTLSAVVSAKSDAEIVIISHESLFGHPGMNGFYGSNGTRNALAQQLVKLNDLGHDVQFILYYKEPYRLLESYYRHYVATEGGTAEPLEFLNFLPVRKMSFLAFIDDLRRAAGTDSVRILYSRIDSEKNFFAKFCQAMGLDLPGSPLTRPPYTNRSWDRTQVTLARDVNRSLDAKYRAELIRAIDRTPSHSQDDRPFIPQVVTGLVQELYAEEHNQIMALLAP